MGSDSDAGVDVRMLKMSSLINLDDDTSEDEYEDLLCPHLAPPFVSPGVSGPNREAPPPREQGAPAGAGSAQHLEEASGGKYMAEHWMADQSFEQRFHDIFTADVIEGDNIVIFQGHFFEKDVLSTTLCVEDGHPHLTHPRNGAS